jgi:hypothetical protein
MYEVKVYTLGNSKAIAWHHKIISDPNSWSLTLTLNPKPYNRLSVDDQYNKFIPQVKQLMEDLSAYFHEAIITGEYTKDYNIHVHIYLVITDDIAFNQNLKWHRKKYHSIGTEYKLKVIDEITPELKNYPFKDITRTLKLADVVMSRFTPRHIVIKSVNTFKPRYTDVKICTKCGKHPRLETYAVCFKCIPPEEINKWTKII